MRRPSQSMWKTMAGILMPMTLLMITPGAATANSFRATITSASNLGLTLTTMQRRLMVLSSTGMYAQLGVRAGDQIVAVNGQRVSAEAAFLNRLAMARRGSSTVTLTVARNGGLFQMNVPALVTIARADSTATASARGAGWMNPDLMVRTSQGVMHRDAAARLGLPSEPFFAPNQARPPAGSVGAAGSGWMNRSLMVRTPMGVMHRDAAIRLGLPHEPF